MKPTIDDAGRLCASPEDMRFLLTEAKRSGQAQISAYGVTTSWRSHWTGRLNMIDGLMAQLPDEAAKGAYTEAMTEQFSAEQFSDETPAAPPIIEDTDLDELLG